MSEIEGAALPIRLLTTALEAAANGVLITDRRGDILWSNRAFTDITGYDAGEVLGRNPRFLKSGHHDPAFYASLWQSILAGQIWHGEMVNRRKDGSLYHEEQTITPVRSDAGAVTHFIAIKQDVSKRVAAERALKEREQLLDAVLNTLPVGVWLTDAQGNIRQGNPAATRIWAGGRYVGPADYGVYKGWWVRTGRPIAPEEWAVARAVHRGETSLNEEIEIECFDGSHKIILNSALPIRSERGEITGAVIVNQDITVEYQAREGLRHLSRRLVEVQESERRFIARELHDDVGQALTSLILGLRLLERSQEQPPEVTQELAKLKELAGALMANLHTISADLFPASLDHVGLVATLHQYGETISSRYGLRVEFEAIGFPSAEVPRSEARLPHDMEVALFRIVQEALENVVREGRATGVDVLLARRSDHVALVIEDNGEPVRQPPHEIRRESHFATVGMQERAVMLGGTLTTESSSGGGTTIWVEVPYADSYTARR